MRRAKKKEVLLRAWRLGADSPMERELIGLGRIVPRDDGSYELFSLEATGRVGQVARRGDYFKVDPPGCPYPNERAYFERNHVHVEGDWYRQIARPLPVWMDGDPACEEVNWLISAGILRIDPGDPEHYYSATLWGTLERAARDAVLVFHAVERDADGAIQSIEFNFVDRKTFDRTYELLT